MTATLGGAGIGWRSGPAVEGATTLAESRVLATESVISVSPYSRGIDEFGFEVVSKGKDEVVRKYRVMAAGDQSREEWTKAVSGLVVSGSGADIATARAEQHKTAQMADEARAKSVEPARRGLKRGTASVRKAEAAARSWRFKTLLGCILAGFAIVFLSKGCGSLDCGEHGRCSGGLIAESCLCTDNHAVSSTSIDLFCGLVRFSTIPTDTKLLQGELCTMRCSAHSRSDGSHGCLCETNYVGELCDLHVEHVRSNAPFRIIFQRVVSSLAARLEFANGGMYCRVSAAAGPGAVHASATSRGSASTATPTAAVQTAGRPR